RVAVRDHGPRALRGVLAAPPPPSDGAAHLRAGLAVAERLAALMGGQIEIDSEPKRAIALSVELPFALDRAALALVLDLAQLPVLIVTGDGQLAAELVEALAAWRAERPCRRRALPAVHRRRGAHRQRDRPRRRRARRDPAGAVQPRGVAEHAA